MRKPSKKPSGCTAGHPARFMMSTDVGDRCAFLFPSPHPGHVMWCRAKRREVMAQEIKACPFCGSGYTRRIDDGIGGQAIQCAGCYAATSGYNTQLEASRAWNRRGGKP